MRIRGVLSLLLILLLPLAVGGCLKKMDVTGSWAGFVVWDEGDPLEGETTTVRLDLSQDRQTVTGNVIMDAEFMYLDFDVVSGHGSNNYITLETAGVVPGTYSTHAIFLSLEGVLDQSRIVGTGSMTVDGLVHLLTWQAQRSS